MVKTDGLVQTTTGATIKQWASNALDIPELMVHLRLRGNNLHVLCESEQTPEMAIAVEKMAIALKNSDINGLLPAEHPHIYELVLYGRELGNKRPAWSVRLDPQNPDSPATLGEKLTEEEAPQEQSDTSEPEPASLSESKPSTSPRETIAEKTSNDSLADTRMMLAAQSRASVGNPEAETLLAKGITRYLNETLSFDNIRLAVLVKPLNATPTSETASNSEKSALRRLWVFCQGSETPDRAAIADPLCRGLRELHLEGFRDAVIIGRVRGASKPDWLLRAELTPPTKMLAQWAKWGDVEALTQWLDRSLAAEGFTLRGVQKDSTLHLFCALSPSNSDEDSDRRLDKQTAIAAIAPLLKSLAPQGLHAATIYGCRDALQETATADAPPLWVDWLDLPAARDPSLSPDAKTLAREGNPEALKFLLERQLNPDLDTKLTTGGIHVSLRCKQQVLHLMLDAPTCPKQPEVTPLLVDFLRQLKLEKIIGVRLYGRRAGQKQPSWRYGASLDEPPTTADSPEPEPTEPTPDKTANEEFPLAQTQQQELLDEAQRVERESAEEVQEELQACLTKQIKPAAKPAKPSAGWLTRLLTATGLLISTKSFRKNPASNTTVALIWGTLGLLLTVNLDRLLGYHPLMSEPPATPTEVAIAGDSSAEAPPATPEPPAPEAEMPDISLEGAEDVDESAFDGSSFTAPKPDRSPSRLESILPGFDYPSFNSVQLDEQLRLYLRYVSENGAPDVLIVGSSRALRGVAPMTLQEALADRYPGLKVFNFGINGATAQVVDFVVRQLLPPEQLPKLILWADGARAFNSGREDRTFEAIARSEGYQTLSQGIRPLLPNSAAPETEESNSLASLTDTLAQTAKDGISLRDSYEQLNDWLEEGLASVSASYDRRDNLKGFLRHQLLVPVAQRLDSPTETPTAIESPEVAAQTADTYPEESMAALSDATTLLTSGNPNDSPSTLLNGFLPLSVRFNPNTYYEKHARVSGSYDADYESFQLAGIQSAALKNLLQFTGNRQIPIVFVNMPLTQEYLDPVRQDYERQFQQYMLGLSMEHPGLSFRDLSQLWPTQNDRFSDPSHLNRYGAQEVSNRLSQDPMIPWPQTQ